MQKVQFILYKDISNADIQMRHVISLRIGGDQSAERPLNRARICFKTNLKKLEEFPQTQRNSAKFRHNLDKTDDISFA